MHFWEVRFRRHRGTLYTRAYIHKHTKQFFSLLLVLAVNLPQTNLALLIRHGQVIGLRRNGH